MKNIHKQDYSSYKGNGNTGDSLLYSNSLKTMADT